MLLLCALVLCFVNAAPAPPVLNLDPMASVSGLSAGGFAASQYGTIFSASVSGVGIFAGGPFYCTEGSWLKVPRCGLTPRLGLSSAKGKLVRHVHDFARKGDIDPAAGVVAQRVYMFSGKLDFTIEQKVMTVTEEIYEDLGVPKANIKTKFDMYAAHAWPTLDEGNFCAVSGPPYLSKCDYDGAGEMLKHFFPGQLKPRVKKFEKSFMIEVDQEMFLPAGKSKRDAEIDDNAFLFVPPACRNGEPCRMHVAFHGCTQGHSFVGKRFIEKNGLNNWAQSNNIVVLYPQAAAYPSSLLGCWDYVGSTGSKFATRHGIQMAMVRNMVKFISGTGTGLVGGQPVDPPQQPGGNPGNGNPGNGNPGNNPGNGNPGNGNPGGSTTSECIPACGQGQSCAQGTCIFVSGNDPQPNDPQQQQPVVPAAPTCLPSCSVGQVCTSEGTCVALGNQQDGPAVVQDETVSSAAVLVPATAWLAMHL